MTAKQKVKKTSNANRNIFLVSLLVSVVFWIVTEFSQNYSHEYQFSVEYTLPDTISFGNIPRNSIQVELYASGWNLFTASLNRGFNRLVIPVEQNIVSRVTLIDAIRKQIKKPEIEVRSLNIDYIDFNLERRIKKEVPILLQSNISFAQDRQLSDSIQLDPGTIELTGPENLIRQINNWKTENIIIENITTDVERTIMLALPVSPLILLPFNEVEIRIPVEQRTDKQIYVQVTVPEKLKIRTFPDRVLVTSSVGLSRYDDLTEDEFRVELNLSQKPEVTQTNAAVHLTKKPDYVTNLDFSPKQVKIILHQDSSKVDSTQFEGID